MDYEYAFAIDRLDTVRPQVEPVDLPGISCHVATVGPSPPQLHHLFQPPQLVRVADRVDAGDPALSDHQADRRVELACQIDTDGGRAVQPNGADHRIRRDRRKAGEEG